MNIQEYSDVALNSARVYFRYLKDHNKGLIKYSVKRIDSFIGGDNHRLFLLQLFESNRIKSSDYIYFLIDGKTFLPSELNIIEIADEGKGIVVEPAAHLEDYMLSLHPSQIEIVSDLKFLVQRIGEWYKNHPSSITPPSNISLQTSSCPVKIAKGKHSPTTEQAKAIESIFQHPLTYIWGAPGTGKTRFVLSHALMHCIQGIGATDNDKIIIMAPTNNAVDQTLFGVLEVLTEQKIPQTKIFRLGTPTHAFFKEYPDICEYSRHSQKKKELQEEVAELRSALVYKKEQKKKLVFLDAVSKSVEQYCALLSMQKELTQQLYDLDLLQRLFTASISDLKATQKQLQAEWKKYTSKGYYFFHNITGNQKASYAKHITDLSARISKNSENLRLTELNIVQSTSQIRTVKENLAKLNIDQARKDLLALSQSCPPLLTPFLRATQMLHNETAIAPSFTAEKENVLAEISSSPYANIEEEALSEMLQEKEFALQNYHDRCSTFESANIIAGTIDTIVGRYDLFANKKKNIFVKHVFIDEAAYAPAIKAMIAFSFGAPVTLLGDHMQLPPVCEMENNPLWSQSAIYCSSLFSDSFAKFCSDFENETPPDFSLMQKYDLTYTHRFGENLAALLAKHVYMGTFRGSAEHLINIHVLNAQKSSNDKNRENSGEATAILEYIRAVSPEDVAILTPYKAQVELLKKTLPLKYKGNIMTVHSAQGKEYDTVIFSVSDTTNMYFTNSQSPIGLRIINTAISRAKNTLVLVCDKSFWHSQKEQLLTQILEIQDQ